MFNQEDYEDLLQCAKEDSTHIFHDVEYGYTVAWHRVGERAKDRMIEVSVAYCSPQEPKFLKKHGTYQVLHNFYDSKNTILMRVGDKNPAVIIERLRDIFRYTTQPD